MPATDGNAGHCRVPALSYLGGLPAGLCRQARRNGHPHCSVPVCSRAAMDRWRWITGLLWLALGTMSCGGTAFSSLACTS